MKQYQVFQTQHRLKFDEEFKQRQEDGWKLFGDVWSIDPITNGLLGTVLIPN